MIYYLKKQNKKLLFILLLYIFIIFPNVHQIPSLLEIHFLNSLKELPLRRDTEYFFLFFKKVITENLSAQFKSIPLLLYEITYFRRQVLNISKGGYCANTTCNLHDFKLQILLIKKTVQNVQG